MTNGNASWQGGILASGMPTCVSGVSDVTKAAVTNQGGADIRQRHAVQKYWDTEI